MIYVMIIKYGWLSVHSSDKNQVFFRAMLWESTDICLLRLLEAFMESAPQLVLQLYILARNSQTIRWNSDTAFIAGVPEDFISEDVPDTAYDRHMANEVSKNDPFLGQGSKTTVIIQMVSVVTSLVSLAWTLTSFVKNTRYVQEKKNDLPGIATVCSFLWHLLTISSRVLALALFSSVFSFWVAVGCVIRWIIMSTWIITIKLNDSKHSHVIDIVFTSVFAFVYLFCFLNIYSDRSRWKYLFFYLYEFIENTMYILLWFHFGDHYTIFYYPAIISYFSCFYLGIIFMFLHYDVFHPTKKFRSFSCFKTIDQIDIDQIDKHLPEKQITFDQKFPHRLKDHELDWTSNAVVKSKQTQSNSSINLDSQNLT